MTTRFALALAAVTLVLVAPSTAAAQLPTHHYTPAQIRAYRDSGKWAKQVEQVTKKARLWLQARTAARHAPRKPALVLDIDDTSIDLYPCFEAANFGYENGAFSGFPGLLTTCALKTDVPAVKPTRALFQRAKKLKVAVFFITGRPEGLRAGTLQELRHAGYTGKYQLVMQPSDYNKPSKVPYKSSARRAIQKRGYKILANVGDQKSDLKGGFSERTFLIKNLMYDTP
jgi:predicted secreted acid phosphatase